MGFVWAVPHFGAPQIHVIDHYGLPEQVNFSIIYLYFYAIKNAVFVITKLDEIFADNVIKTSSVPQLPCLPNLHSFA